MRKRKRKAESLPWYRARNYEGDLTEAEKRLFDALRMQPTAREDDLPEEVKNYIGRIELELHDKKQKDAASQAMFLSAIGAALLFVNYSGYFGAPSIWTYAGAVLLLVLPWIFYWYQWHKNAEETDEAIRREWELNYLTHSRRAEHDASFNGS